MPFSFFLQHCSRTPCKQGFDRHKSLRRERGGVWGGEREAPLQKGSLSPPQSSKPHIPLHLPHDDELVSLTAGRTVVVEEIGKLPVPADHLGRLDERPGEAVVRAAARAGKRRKRHVDGTFLRMMDVRLAMEQIIYSNSTF